MLGGIPQCGFGQVFGLTSQHGVGGHDLCGQHGEVQKQPESINKKRMFKVEVIAIFAILLLLLVSPLMFLLTLEAVVKALIVVNISREGFLTLPYSQNSLAVSSSCFVGSMLVEGSKALERTVEDSTVVEDSTLEDSRLLVEERSKDRDRSSS